MIAAHAAAADRAGRLAGPHHFAGLVVRLHHTMNDRAAEIARRRARLLDEIPRALALPLAQRRTRSSALVALVDALDAERGRLLHQGEAAEIVRAEMLW